VGRSWVYLEDPLLNTEDSPVKRFHNSLNTSSWNTWAPVFTPFSQKWRGVPPPRWDTHHQTMA
jgi:hypothetical protein